MSLSTLSHVTKSLGNGLFCMHRIVMYGKTTTTEQVTTTCTTMNLCTGSTIIKAFTASICIKAFIGTMLQLC